VSEAVLELETVDLRYGRQLVVHGASLAVRRGQWMALVGPNASGKTTVLRCAAGRLAPARGSARFNGVSMYAAQGRSAAVPGFAVAPEELPAFLTVRQSLEIYADAHGLSAIPERSWQLCRDLSLAEHANQLVRHLSLGTRQKLAVVLALLGASPLLLVDEVFNGLDIKSALQLKQHMHARVRDGLAILMATHSLDVVQDYCDGLALIDSGRVVTQWGAEQLRRIGTTADLEQALAAELERSGRQ